MNAGRLYFEAPAGRNRHDALATGSVLGAMLVAAVAGAFVIDVDPAPAFAAIPTQYAAVEEGQ